MWRWIFIALAAAAIPFIIYSGMRRRLAYALSVTATLYLILIIVRVLTGFAFFRVELENTIGAIAIVSLVAVAAYTVIRHYADRAVQRKLAERRRRPEAHRSLLENVRRSLKI